VAVNFPIYLSITSKNSFPYKENKRLPNLEDFPCRFFLLSLAGFPYLKGDCERLLKMKNSTTLFPISTSINSTKQVNKIKNSRQHVRSMERGLKGLGSTH
jgi:hypothetical protein